MQLAPRDNRDAMTTGGRSLRVTVALTLAIGVAMCGCRPADPSAPPPPGGGNVWVLDEAIFAANVAPVLTARGCDAIECHGGGIRGTFALSPAGDKDLAFDFEQAALQVTGTDPAASPLLRKPLAVTAGGTPHAGDAEGGIFVSTADPDYQTILAWIAAGESR